MTQSLGILFPETRSTQELEAFRRATPVDAVLTVYQTLAGDLAHQIPQYDSDETLEIVLRFPGLPDAIAGRMRGMQSYNYWLYYGIKEGGTRHGFHYHRGQNPSVIQDYVDVLEEALGRSVNVVHETTRLENLQRVATWTSSPPESQPDLNKLEDRYQHRLFGTPHDSIRAVIFDLDNTLAATDHLESCRRTGDRQGLQQILTTQSPAVHDDLRRVLSEISQFLPLAVVTVAPSWYARHLLTALFPEIHWNEVITYSDVERRKPFPDGFQLAARRLGVDAANVLVVGDSRDDVEAAYHAGMQIALATWHTTDMDGKRFIPDTVMTEPGELLTYLTSPALSLPYLEAWVMGEDWEGLEWIEPVQASTDVPGHPRLPVEVLGRYFPNYGQTAHLHTKHVLSQQIIAKRLPQPFLIPEVWRYPLTVVLGAQDVDIVTVVPAKPGKDPRLERMLDTLSVGDTKEYRSDLLAFEADTVDISKLPANEKYPLVKQRLSVKGVCAGKRVLVIDDVMTQGATLQAATEKLLEAGAVEVKRLVLARTISPTWFNVQNEVRFCPQCGGMMVRFHRRNDNSLFWGCKMFFSNGCKYTENGQVA